MSVATHSDSTVLGCSATVRGRVYVASPDGWADAQFVQVLVPSQMGGRTALKDLDAKAVSALPRHTTVATTVFSVAGGGQDTVIVVGTRKLLFADDTAAPPWSVDSIAITIPECGDIRPAS